MSSSYITDRILAQVARSAETIDPGVISTEAATAQALEVLDALELIAVQTINLH